MERTRITAVAAAAAAAAFLLGGASAPAAPTAGVTPAIVTGAGAAGGPHVRGWNALGQKLPEPDFMAYPTFAGGVRVASGDVDDDGMPEIVTGPGPSGASLVRVFDGASHELKSELATFDWSGGVFVASGDVNDDGKADIVAGADFGGGSDIQVHDGASGRRLAWFATRFGSRGARVAVGDVSGDGRAEILAAPGPGGPPRVELYAADGGNACGCGDGVPFRTLEAAFPAEATSGLVVASGDVNGDHRAEVIVGAVTNAGPQVKALDAASGVPLASFFPYGAAFQGALSIAAGDLDGDGVAEIVTSTLTSGGSEIRAFDAQGRLVSSFFSVDPSLSPGLSVAVADVDGDGLGEIVAGGGPSFGDQRVTVFDPAGRIQSGFLAYEPFFAGGVRVAVGNVRGSGAPEIVTAPGAGRPAEVEVFDLEGELLTSFLPFGARFTGGAFVAVGDLDGDLECEIVVGAGSGAEPRVKVFDGSGRELRSFLAFEPDFRGGVRVAVGDADGDGKGEIVAGAGPGGANRIEVVNETGVVQGSFAAFSTAETNGVFVAAGDLEGDGRGEIIVGTEASGSPALARVLDARTGDVRFTQPISGCCGAHVATGDLDENGSDEIIVGSGSGIGFGQVAHVTVFRAYLGRSFSFVPYERFEGGTFVAAPARVGPALAASGTTISAVEGRRFSGVVATFSDSARRDSAADFTASISWSDGPESRGTIAALGNGTFRVLGTQTYREKGVYPVLVTISDARGRTVRARSVARARAASLVARVRSLTIPAGRTFIRVVAILRDGNPYATANEFRTVIRWGDGTRSPGRVVRFGAGLFRVLGRHRYERPGRYVLALHVHELGGRTVDARGRIRATGSKAG